VTDRKHPFAGLEALRDKLPPGKAPVDKPVEKKGPARAVVRLTRKGRAGKDATLIEKLELAPAELERWSRELKAALGVGGGVEDDAIVLQGDCRARVEPMLVGRGVRKVVLG
jgi:translation initiation factor 1